jgi:uncharacterized protein (DUF433 family)
MIRSHRHDREHGHRDTACARVRAERKQAAQPVEAQMIHQAHRHERIVVDPKIMVGKPTIKGTRITVELILRKLGDGMTPDEILEDHPHLSRDDIRAAQAFAADYLADEAVILAEP